MVLLRHAPGIEVYSGSLVRWYVVRHTPEMLFRHSSLMVSVMHPL
jgi:hypothetical protein